MVEEGEREAGMDGAASEPADDAASSAFPEEVPQLVVRGKEQRGILGEASDNRLSCPCGDNDISQSLHGDAALDMDDGEGVRVRFPQSGEELRWTTLR